MLVIYTPTYNREKELHKLYKSLCDQDNKNFQWLVIDDGSTDNTECTIHNWIKENIISISYKKKNNGGKHTALNMALEIVDDYWNFCLDSDDWLINSNVVSTVLSDIKDIEYEKDIISIVYPYQFKNKKIKKKNRHIKLLVDCDPRDKKLGVSETTILSRPNAYREIRFPIFQNENFISEGAIETPKLFKGKRVYIHDPIVEGEYLETGLSRNIIKLWKDNPKGYFYVRNLQLKYYNENKMFIKSIIPISQMIALNIKLKRPLFYDLGNSKKGNSLIAVPLGIMYWLKVFKKVGR